MQKIVIIKYNAGNIGSVGNALERLGVYYEITDDFAQIRGADKVIFPGVGEASTTMAHLEANGLAGLIRELTQPVLGICLGMQLMCSWTEEGDTMGLGIFPERVARFRIGEKVPHMGWNAVHFEGNQLFAKVKTPSWFYFVHSYFAEKGPSCAGTTWHGVEFASCLQRDNFFATQFHPEKSAVAGQELLKTFIAL